jgi:hypothetical protein
MKIKFDILNQEIDLGYVFKNKPLKSWYFSNCNPSIPIATKQEDLTHAQKVSLINLAMKDLTEYTNESFFSDAVNNFRIKD